MKKTLVLGLGNPILTDDGVGILVVRALKERPLPPGTDTAEASLGGLRLLEIIAGYDRLILVDAIQTAQGRPGEVIVTDLDKLRVSLHSGSTHDLSLSGALNLGRELGMAIPGDSDIAIVAVEVEDVGCLGETPTPAVEAAVPEAVEQVLTILENQKHLSQDG